jgi:F-type H+-transporting ATPase subunit b
MKRSLRVLLILCFAAWIPEAFAQQPEMPSEKPESFAEKHELELKWANFLILAGALGYLIGKHAGPFFAARSGSIRKDMVESQQQREAAEAQAAEVDRRLANLEKEISALRGDSQAQAQTENQRMAQHTAGEIAKIQAHAEQEIASAGKAARMELKRYSAQLAVELAERKIRARMTPQTQDALVRGFVRDLK